MVTNHDGKRLEIQKQLFTILANNGGREGKRYQNSNKKVNYKNTKALTNRTDTRL